MSETSGLRISVAMAAYDGEAHLIEQLESLRRQSHPPAEVVVCDDGSSDGTAGLAEEFASGAGFPVRVSVNAARLGITKNFERAIALCRGDVIALSDQDDVWKSDKLERYAAIFRARPEVGFVFGESELIDEGSRPLGRRHWNYTPAQIEGIRSGRLFRMLLRRNVVTGGTLAFRARWREAALPIPPGWYHDPWLALVLAALGAAEVVPDPVNEYRQHGGQHMGGARRTLAAEMRMGRVMGRKDFARALENVRLLAERLARVAPGLSAPDRRALAGKERHLSRRLAMREHPRRRWPLAVSGWLSGDYSRFDLGWRSLGQDLFLLRPEWECAAPHLPLWNGVCERGGRGEVR